MQTRWTYKAIKMSYPTFARSAVRLSVIEDELNRLGRDGWELVTTSNDGLEITYYLKRPV